MKYILTIVILMTFGCSGVDEPNLEISANSIEQLRKLKSEKKFVEYKPLLYPGAPNENIRVKAESSINSLIQGLLDTEKKDLTKSHVLNKFRHFSPQFQNMDSEEIERSLTYMEQIMDIYSIDSSDGLLNELRYGFDPSRKH